MGSAKGASAERNKNPVHKPRENGRRRQNAEPPVLTHEGGVKRFGRSPDSQAACALFTPSRPTPVGSREKYSCLQLRGSCRIARHSRFHSMGGNRSVMSKNRGSSGTDSILDRVDSRNHRRSNLHRERMTCKTNACGPASLSTAQINGSRKRLSLKPLRDSHRSQVVLEV